MTIIPVRGVMAQRSAKVPPPSTLTVELYCKLLSAINGSECLMKSLSKSVLLYLSRFQVFHPVSTRKSTDMKAEEEISRHGRRKCRRFQAVSKVQLMLDGLPTVIGYS